jgi:hypothetical protein
LQVLVQPLKSLGGTRSVWRKVLVSWLLALVFALPQLFIFVQTEETTTRIIARQSAPQSSSLEAAVDDPQPYTLPPLKVTRTTLECKSVGYTEWWQRKVYFTFLTTYILVIPTSIMTFCYSRIIRAVWLRAATNGPLPGGGSGGGDGFSRPVDIDAPRIHFVTTRKQQQQQQMRGGHRGGGVGGHRTDRGVGGSAGQTCRVVETQSRQDDDVGDRRVRSLLDPVFRRQSHTHLLGIRHTTRDGAFGLRTDGALSLGAQPAVVYRLQHAGGPSIVSARTKPPHGSTSSSSSPSSSEKGRHRRQSIIGDLLLLVVLVAVDAVLSSGG